MSKKKQEYVTFEVIKPLDLSESWTRYYVQVWREPEFYSLTKREHRWIDQGYGHESLADAVKQYERLTQTYAKVQVVERTNTNRVVLA